MADKNLQYWEDELKNLKCRAESLLESMQPIDAGVDMGVDKLREEFQTVNVELEMQCEELQRARQQLEQSQQYLADIFEQTPIGYLIVNDEGVIRSSNQAASEMFQMKKELLQNQRLTAFIPPSCLDSFRLGFRRAKSNKTSQTVDTCFRIRHGETLHARATFFYLRSTYDNENVLVCSLLDVGAELAQRQLEQERNQQLEERVQHRTQELTELNETLRNEVAAKSIAQQKAESASRVKAKFLAAMSHDIRTPLNGISMAFQILQEMGQDDGTNEIIRLGTDSTQILHELINQVLDYSRLEAGALNLRKTPFTPIEHFESTLDVVRKDIQKKGLTLTVEVASGIPAILEGDPLRFKQILLNLLGNAIKYTDEGTIYVALRQKDLDERSQQVCLELLVKDSGIGIPNDQLSHIFEPFRQIDSENRAHIEGSGLGLAIVKELVAMMGGAVHIESKVGEGTEVQCHFWLDFSSTFQSSTIPQAESYTVETPGNLFVLLVEDNRTNAALLEKMLTKVGWDVLIAYDGQSALDLMRRKECDLILMDIDLPDISGPEVLNQFKKSTSLSVNRSTPVIALTAFALKDDKEKFLAMGFDGYISKPVRKKPFFDEINSTLKSMTGLLRS